MSCRYEIKDRENPIARGYRRATLAAAGREHAHSVPLSRFYVLDRTTGEDVTAEAHEAHEAEAHRPTAGQLPLTPGEELMRAHGIDPTPQPFTPRSAFSTEGYDLW